MLIVGLPYHAVAETTRATFPDFERFSEATAPFTAAKHAAALAARSRARLPVPQWKSVGPGSYVTFDAPGAVKGTFAEAVSALGQVTGYYVDANFIPHGFLRASNGTLVTIDVPGAINGTYAWGINDEGSVVGGYVDNVGSGLHSFLREPDGTIFKFDPPAQFGAQFGSEAWAVNEARTTTGFYLDENHMTHGYLRTSNGKFVSFDPPGADGTGLPYLAGTFPTAITPNKIVGLYSHAYTISGFELNAYGQITEISGPGGLENGYDPFNAGPQLSINRSGDIAGTYFVPLIGNPVGGYFRVFVRSSKGKYIAFDAATYGPCCISSAPSGINDAGTVTGSFNDAYGINHGFWRTSNGTVTTFDIPGAGTGYNQGTLPIGITAAGVIAGVYVDATNVFHGFVFRPTGV
jgi:uncharacterized membrane protein